MTDSQWATRDAAARLAVRRNLPTTERAHFSQYKSAQTLYNAVVTRYTSPATAALSRLFLPYQFPNLTAFPTVADLITHLRTSDTRFRATLPVEFCAKNPPPMYLTLYYVVTRLPDSHCVVRDHFLSVCPTTLTVDLLKERLLAAEQSIVAVGASRGDPRTPIFEGCSPSPLLTSVASAATADLGGFESASCGVTGAGTTRSPSGTTLRSSAVGGCLFPLRSKDEVTEVLIDWIRAARLQLRESFGSDFPVLRLHSDRGGEISSARLGALCRAQGIRQTFTLPASPQQNGIAERRIGMVMDVARTSMIHAAAPHFLWQFAVQYAAHQLNLQPRVSLPETSPTLLWTGKVGDASAFRVWGSRAFVRDLSAEKLSPCATPCDDTFDESVPYYRLFPYRTAPLPPPPLFLAPGPPPVDPLPPQGPAPSGVSQVDAVEPVEVAVDSGAAGGAELGGAEPGGAESELLSPQELCEWFARRWSHAAGAGGPPVAPGPGGARTGGTGAVGTGGAAAAAGVGLAGASGAAGAGAPGGVGAGVGATGASGAAGSGATGGVGAGVGPAGGTAGLLAVLELPVLLELVLLELGVLLAQVLPLVVLVLFLLSQLQPVSPLPAPSPYAGPTRGLAERREPASCPASPVRTTRTSRRAPRPRPPAVPGTHQMTLRPSTAPLRVPLPSPPESSLPVLADPASDSLRAASPTEARLLSTVVTDPSFESTAVSALVAELVDFAARCRLDYAASLVAESASVCPPSVGGECALSTDVFEDRQEEFYYFSAALPHLVSTLIAPEGDPDAPDIPTPRSYAEEIEGPYSSQWLSAMDAEMASWKSTGTYVDEVPPPGVNIVSGMWIFRVKRPPGCPPDFKARYVARGFS
ncbi:unnamed protein product [Closterium sp. NIES-54]